MIYGESVVRNDVLVRDMVFPIVLCQRESNGSSKMIQFLGTGFLFGKKNYALTASHVVDFEISDPNSAVLALFIGEDNKWRGQSMNVIAVHPKEDVALLKLSQDIDHSNKPNFTLSFEKCFSGLTYKLFGYPQANLYENVDLRDAHGKLLGRPDLIFSEGHIRRRTNCAYPNIRGTSLYELSTPVGKGCSGSPVFEIHGGIWKVFGVYVADQIKTICFESLDENLNKTLKFVELSGEHSYAVRLDALQDWPIRSGESLLDFI